MPSREEENERSAVNPEKHNNVLDCFVVSFLAKTFCRLVLLLAKADKKGDRKYALLWQRSFR